MAVCGRPSPPPSPSRARSPLASPPLCACPPPQSRTGIHQSIDRTSHRASPSLAPSLTSILTIPGPFRVLTVPRPFPHIEPHHPWPLPCAHRPSPLPSHRTSHALLPPSVCSPSLVPSSSGSSPSLLPPSCAHLPAPRSEYGRRNSLGRQLRFARSASHPALTLHSPCTLSTRPPSQPWSVPHAAPRTLDSPCTGALPAATSLCDVDVSRRCVM
jgi:hypothetical protein